MGLIDGNTAEYYSISYGKLRRKTTADDPEAVKRVYEDKDGKEKEVYEVVKRGVTGIIDSVETRKGDYGKQLYIGIVDGMEKFYINMPFDSPYAKTFLERLPNVNLSREVALVPYSFTDDRGKVRSGLSVYYDYGEETQEKINSFFKEYEGNKISKYLYGYPHGNDDTEDEEWKIIGLQQIKYLQKNVVDKFPFYEKEEKEPEVEKDDPEDDLPF